MTTLHVIAAGLWLVLLAITATTYALTRDRRAYWALAVLLGPIAGAVWVWTQVRDEHEPPPSPTDAALEDLDAMDAALPDDHPDVSPGRRARAERRAELAGKLDDASRDDLEQLDRELAELLED